jgi:hypothetical protein
MAFEIPKVSFEPGEEVKIVIDCDNSAARLGVKSFKFKLFRRIETSVDYSGNKNNKISLVDAFQFDSKNGRF